MSNNRNINRENYPTLFKICCLAGKYEFVKNLYTIFYNYKEIQSFKNNEEIAAAACFSGNPKIVRLLESEGFYFGEFCLEKAFISGNFKIFDFLLENNLVDLKDEDKDFCTIHTNLVINNYNNLERLFYYNMGETDEDYLKRKNTGLLTKKEVQRELKYTQLKKREIISELEDVQMELDECKEQSQIDILLGKQEEILSVIKNLEKRENKLKSIKYNFLKIDVNAKGYHGDTLLNYAAGYGYIETVKLLLEQPNININEKNNFGDTPLHDAALFGHEEIVKLLLSQPDIDINAKDNEGNNPLHCAALKYTEVVKLLLKQPGIDINAKNNKGETSLHCAVNYGYKKVVLMLLSNKNLIIEDDSLKNKIKRRSTLSKKIRDELDAYELRKRQEQQNAFVDNLEDANNAINEQQNANIRPYNELKGK